MNIKFPLIALLSSLFLFSCSSDDDNNNDSSDQLADGWTPELVDIAVDSCEDEGDEDIDISVNCKCAINEIAKVIPLSDFRNIEDENDLSDAQTNIIAEAFGKCLQK